jgi:putative transposase
MQYGKRRTPEQIVRILRDVEAGHVAGRTMAQMCQELGISEKSYYRWKQAYGGMTTSELTRLKELEAENLRLKKLVADLSLDNAMLKELAEGNF